MQLDERTCTRVTNYLLEWIQADSILDHPRLTWLFSLLVCLDRPTHADTDGNLRGTLRTFCARRAKMRSLADPLLPELNVIITIITKCFGQLVDSWTDTPTANT